MNKLLIVLMFSLCTLNILSQNLLVNPSFETWASAKPIGWTITNSAYISQNNLIYSLGATSCKVDLEQINKNVTLTQNVAVTASKTYRFTVSYLIERGDGMDARISCNFKDASNKAIPMSLDDSLTLKGPGGNSAYFTTVLGVWKTYTCDVVAPVNATVFVYSVRSSPYSIVYWDNFSFEINNQPTVTLSSTNLNGFSYTPGDGPSAEKSFTVKGSNLSNSITVIPPANFEISLTSGAQFNPKSSIILPQTNGLVNSTSIFVRLKSNLSVNDYTGSISVNSTGVSTQNVTLAGSVELSPSNIALSLTALSGFSYVEGSGPSTIKSFKVSGSGLSNGITLTAPAGYEISIFSGLSFVGANTFTISQVNGLVASTSIYVRLKSGLVPDSYNGDIQFSSNGSTNSISLSGSVNSIPQLFISTTTLSGFRYEPGSGPSDEKSFVVSGIGMTTAVVLSAIGEYEMSTGTGTNFNPTSQIILAQTDGNLDSTTIYVRLKDQLTAAIYTGRVSLVTSNGISKTVNLNGIVSVPQEVNISTNSLSGFEYRVGEGPSSQRSISLSANGLSEMLVVTAPENYEISLEGSSLFAGNDQLLLSIGSGSISNTTIYVRLKSGLIVSDDYSGNIIFSSGGDVLQQVVLSGSVKALPVVNVSVTSLSGFFYVPGTGTCEEEMFTVNAENLVSDLSLNAPFGYELSLTSGDNFVGTSSLEINEVNGIIETISIYVRLISGLEVNNYIGDIEIFAEDITTKYITLNGNVSIPTFSSDNQSQQTIVFSKSNCIYIKNHY